MCPSHEETLAAAADFVGCSSAHFASTALMNAGELSIGPLFVKILCNNDLYRGFAQKVELESFCNCEK